MLCKPNRSCRPTSAVLTLDLMCLCAWVALYTNCCCWACLGLACEKRKAEKEAEKAQKEAENKRQKLEAEGEEEEEEEYYEEEDVDDGMEGDEHEQDESCEGYNEDEDW